MTVDPSRTDLAYGPDPAHRLDLYLPGNATGPLPVAIHVHGGGWMTGDKSWLYEQDGLSALTALLLAEGWAVVAVNYRLSGTACFPAGADDVAAALDWLLASAGELGLDGSRMVVTGDSAGAHLGLLAAYRETGARVRAVVSFYGVPDLGVAVRERQERVAAGSEIRGFFLGHMVHPPTPEGRFLGAEPDSPDGAPLAEASSAVRRAGPDSPPTLLFAGRYDAVAGTAAAEQLAAGLARHGVPARCVIVEAGHGEPEYYTDPARQRELLDFLAEHAG